MSTHNIDFYKDLTNIIFQLSSNMQLISSSVLPKHTDHGQASLRPFTCT